MNSDDKLQNIKGELYSQAQSSLIQYSIELVKEENSSESYYESAKLNSQASIYVRLLKQFFADENLEQIFNELKESVIVNVHKYIEDYDSEVDENTIIETIDDFFSENV
jgi:beta-lactam-binding protein with PASTA domain